MSARALCPVVALTWALWLSACLPEVEGDLGPSKMSDLPDIEPDSGAPDGGATSDASGDVDDLRAVDFDDSLRPAPPQDVQHAAWWGRLTESPEISWSASSDETVVGYQIAIGSSEDRHDALPWLDVGEVTSWRGAAIFADINVASVYYAQVRAVNAAGIPSLPAVSAGWTLDIVPPEAPTAIDDERLPVDGTLSWEGLAEDAPRGVGFKEFIYAIGTRPGATDLLDWTSAGAQTSAKIDLDALDLEQGALYFTSVRAVDGVGNRSAFAVSPGWLSCPESYLYVPPDSTLGTSFFCVSKYEMSRPGVHDGNGPPLDDTDQPVASPSALPWVDLDRAEARVACGHLGDQYNSISVLQWQAVARSIERTAENWSGGQVGSGAVNKGHTDNDPSERLEPHQDDAKACHGTLNPRCLEPDHEDFRQKRTHRLHNGQMIWDLSGNVFELVENSPGLEVGTQWLEFDDPAFDDPELRRQFGPEGPYGKDEGLGRLYQGVETFTRGGSFSWESQHINNLNASGIYSGHHNRYNSRSPSTGFRCVFGL